MHGRVTTKPVIARGINRALTVVERPNKKKQLNVHQNSMYAALFKRINMAEKNEKFTAIIKHYKPPSFTN